MALTTCRECKKQVSDTAKTCPHCGAPKPYKTDWKGSGYEWKSQTEFMGYPMIHIAVGRDQNGKLRVAKGVVAVGQFGIGLITFAQFGIGILFGFGQFILGITAIAQFAITLLFGIGQIATGYIAIGQMALGYYVLCQHGLGVHTLSSKVRDPQAIEYFQHLGNKLKSLF